MTTPTRTATRTLSAICALAFAASPALAQKMAMSTPAMTDQQFVDFAAQTDMVEANLGQLAQTAASAQPVKDYGQMLVTDHTKDYGQLATIAKQAGLQIPTAIGAPQNKMMIDPVEKLKGASFDHKYTQEMILGHTKALAIYKMEAADARNPALKAYAQQDVPVLEKHIAGAKSAATAK